MVKVISGDNILTYDKRIAAEALEKIKKQPQDEKGNPVSAATESRKEIDPAIDCPELQTLAKYYDELSQYQYGWYYDGKIHECTGDDDDQGNLTIVQHPNVFKKNRAGTCFDYTVYQQLEFVRNGLKAKSYFIWLGMDLRCHTLTVVEINGFYYWFECAAKEMMGIYKSENLYDIFSFFIYNSLRTDPNANHGKVRITPKVFAIKDVNLLISKDVNGVADTASNGRELTTYHYSFGKVKPLYEAYGGPVFESQVATQAMESMEDFRSTNWEIRYHIIDDPDEQELLDNVNTVWTQAVIRLGTGTKRSEYAIFGQHEIMLVDEEVTGFEFRCYGLNIIRYTLKKLYERGIMNPMVMVVTNFDNSHWTVVLVPFAQGMLVIDPAQGLFYETSPYRVMGHGAYHCTICELEAKFAHIGGGEPKVSVESDALSLFRDRRRKDFYRISSNTLSGEEFLSIACAGRKEDDIFAEIDAQTENQIMIDYKEVDPQDKLHRVEVCKHGVFTRSVGGR